MIYLENGQGLLDNPEYVVCDISGEYNDTDLVICAKIEYPSDPYSKFEAQYVAYGSMVYSISDKDDLKDEIVKLDPDAEVGVITENSVAGESLPVLNNENITDPIVNAIENTEEQMVPEDFISTDSVNIGIDEVDSEIISDPLTEIVTDIPTNEVTSEIIP